MRSARKFGDAAMPLFAYRCRSCGEAFQTLVMSGETPVCKACESADLEQQLSLIATPAKGGDDAPMAGLRLAQIERSVDFHRYLECQTQYRGVLPSRDRQGAVYHNFGNYVLVGAGLVQGLD